MLVPQRQALEFQDAIERRMLQTGELRNVHQAANRAFVEDFSAGRKPRTQLEGKDLRVAPTDLAVQGGLLASGFAVQARALKDGGDSADAGDGIELPAIKAYEITFLILNVGPGNKRHVIAQTLARPA